MQVDAISGSARASVFVASMDDLSLRLHTGDETRKSDRRVTFIEPRVDVLHQTKCTLHGLPLALPTADYTET